MRLIKRLMDGLDSTLLGIGTVFIILISVLMLAEIVLRQVFGIGLQWSQVVVTMLLPFIVFLLMGPVARENEHIRIGFFAELILRKRAKVIMAALENIFALGICSFLIWASYRLISLRMKMGSTMTLNSDPPIEIPDWIPIVVLAIGLFLAIVFYLERVFKQIRSLRRPEAGKGSGPESSEMPKEPTGGKEGQS